MNCAYVSGRSFLSKGSAFPKHEFVEEIPTMQSHQMEFGQNFGEWVKRSIMSDVGQVEALPYQPPPTPGYYQSIEEVENFWLMQQAQEIAQSSGEKKCTCSLYSLECQQCLCQLPSAKLAAISNKPGFINQTPEQDTWLNELLDIEAEQERLRYQKEQSYQSAVPDASLECIPYYMGYNDESSIYDQEPLPKEMTTYPSNFGTTPYQTVPKVTTTNSTPKTACPVNNIPPPKKTSRPRLCNFLLELLGDPQQYSDVVEWVDKEKGVFKFVNSAEVALEWGRRRNKPHMKYENFARSLRTYIAKGILTKPRSKLVYRFTSKVH